MDLGAPSGTGIHPPPPGAVAIVARLGTRDALAPFIGDQRRLFGVALNYRYFVPARQLGILRFFEGTKSGSNIF